MQLIDWQQMILARGDAVSRGEGRERNRNGLRRFSPFALVVAGFLASPSGLAASPLPEPALHASRDMCADIAPATETERELLRLEYRSRQTRNAENDAVAELLARIARMGKTITELHDIIAAIPNEPCQAAAVPACPAVAETTEDAFAERPWLAIAAGAGLLGLTVFLARRRKAPAIEVARHTPAPVPEQAPRAEPTTVLRQAAKLAEKAPAKAPPTPHKPAPAPLLTEAIPGATLVPEVPHATDDELIDESDLSLELADVMVSMGLTGGAAQTLEGHIRQHPRQALIHWLKLLDVYRRVGQRDEFDKAARELQENFNIAPPPWQPIARPNIRPTGLEDYPHVITRILELWPRKSCAQYMNRLLDDNRGGTRSGFPQVVVDELMLLLNIMRD